MAKQIRADLLLLTITIIWGSSFPLMKNVIELLPSFAFLTLRFTIAFLILVVIFFRNFKFITPRTLKYGFILGLMMFGGMAFQISGLYYTTASNSAFITGMSVVLVPVVSTFLLKKKPGWPSVIGVILAFSGLFFLSGGLSFKFNLGDFLTLLCALCWTFQVILTDKFIVNEDPVLLAILQIGFAAVLYSFVWGVFDPRPVAFNWTILVTLLITGVLGTALAYTGQTIVQKDTSPTHTALIFTAEPVFGAVFAMLIPNSAGATETLTLTTIIGCLLIITGMLVSELKIKNKVCKDRFENIGFHV
jgi:drug/metabolite transporter (DMT)-like permease